MESIKKKKKKLKSIIREEELKRKKNDNSIHDGMNKRKKKMKGEWINQIEKIMVRVKLGFLMLIITQHKLRGVCFTSAN